MSKNNTDVMIRTRVSLSDEEFSELAERVKTISGVTRFERNRKIPNLVMVAYNAGQTRAISILTQLTRMGFRASLVGM